MNILKKVINLLWPYKNRVLLSVFFNAISVIFSLVSLAMIIPFLRLLFGLEDAQANAPILQFSVSSAVEQFNYAVSQLILNYDKSTALLFICALVLVVFLLKNFFLYLGAWVMIGIRISVVALLRNQLYQKILDLPLRYFSNERKGDLISRISTDVQLVESDIIKSLLTLIREPLTILIYLLTMFWISASLTIFVLVCLPISGFIISRIGRSLKRNSIASQQSLGNLMSIVEESLSGLSIIKAFNATTHQSQKYETENNRWQQFTRQLFLRKELASPLSETMGIALVVAVLWYGGSLVLNNKSPLDAEVFIAFILIFSQLIQPAKKLVTAIYNIQKGAASFERIESVLNEPVEPHIIPKNNLQKFSFQHNIHFKNIEFAYEDKTVLHQIDFKINKGEALALVGQSGSGKSTLADLLMRFYTIKQGAILIDGININIINKSELRALFGLVTQQPILFNDTVFNNIAFGLPNISKAQVIQAAKIANAHNFIENLPNGYQTIIGEGGNKLSGGEKQRLTIARAVVKNPPILILDEATSALDAESENLVQEALAKVMQNRTTLLIAHRLATVQHANKILVLQNGHIIEQGSHFNLIKQGGAYAKLVEMQAL